MWYESFSGEWGRKEERLEDSGMYSEEVRYACMNHYKFSALMSLRSRDNVQAKCTELLVIRARMSDLLWDVLHVVAAVVLA